MPRQVRLPVAIILVSTLMLVAAKPQESQKIKRFPKFSKVSAEVERDLRASKDYRSGDIISRDEVEAVFERLKQLGWNVRDRKEIAEETLANDSFLVRELRTEDGHRFMRQISSFPNAYDRLERLAGLADGERIVQRLIAGPDGYKMMEYLTEASGGEQLGQMLSEAPQGQDFNRPTGRIYTAQQLLERLKTSHERASASKKAAARP
jgi:hypothetical protein